MNPLNLTVRWEYSSFMASKHQCHTDCHLCPKEYGDAGFAKHCIAGAEGAGDMTPQWEKYESIKRVSD